LAGADVDQKEFCIGLAELGDIAIYSISYPIGFDPVASMIKPKFRLRFLFDPVLLFKIVKA